jgi:RNA polymerase sigma-70 factor (ECF subfamily)
VLKEYHGLTFQEIADLMNCPLSTVRTRLYQGLAVLRRELAKETLTREAVTKVATTAQSADADSPDQPRRRRGRALLA